ncbi:hypothetical protein ACFQ9X_10360 [Catenulispora yoronensis]
MAVEWDTPDGVATGVYVFRRDTDSALAAALGGMRRATFGVIEGGGRYSVRASAFSSGGTSLSAWGVAGVIFAES